MSFVIQEVKDAGRLADDENDGHYSFHWMETKFDGLSSKEIKENFMKWNIDQNLRVAKFRFDEPWKLSEDKSMSLLLDFFNSKVFRENVEVRSKAGWGSMGEVTGLDGVEKVKATVTTVAVFDALKDTTIATAEGRIRKCAPDEYEGIQIEDKLREAILMEDAESYDEVPEDLREEFIFKLFTHLVFGGALNQYEEHLTPYTDSVKLIYKDLMSVSKNVNTGKIEIASHVFQINKLRTKSAALFPSDHPLNACWICVDPFRRQLTWYYYAHTTMWG